MVDVEFLEQRYFQNNDPVPYELGRGGELLIHPILLKDKFEYDSSLVVLELKKNEINDIKVISMSYLQFLNEYIFTTQPQMLNGFLWLCEHCLKYQNVSIQYENNKCFLVLLNDEDEIDKIISSKEFDDIAKIILNQNNADYDNRYINPDVREMMMDFYKVKYKDVAYPSLEKKKAFVCSKSGKTFKEVGEYTCREFDLIYNEMLNSEIYIGEKIIQGSFKFDIKEDIKHPMFRKKTDPYEEIFEDTNVLSKKGMTGGQNLI